MHTVVCEISSVRRLDIAVVVHSLELRQPVHQVVVRCERTTVSMTQDNLFFRVDEAWDTHSLQTWRGVLRRDNPMCRRSKSSRGKLL